MGFLTTQEPWRERGRAASRRRYLREHIERTRAESGCISFAVTSTGDPLTWSVEERIESARASDLHRQRVARSDSNSQLTNSFGSSCAR